MKHALNWFEIPATHFDRAVKFYSDVLGTPLRKEMFNGTPNGIFPYDADGNNSVGGAVIYDQRVKPTDSGPIVYLNLNNKLDEALTRVEPAGGKVLLPKTDIGVGSIAIILDSEGNRVGLHSY